MCGNVSSNFHCLFLVDGELISSIKEGLCVLVGISKHDSRKDIEYMLVKGILVDISEVGSNFNELWDPRP